LRRRPGRRQPGRRAWRHAGSRHRRARHLPPAECAHLFQLLQLHPADRLWRHPRHRHRADGTAGQAAWPEGELMSRLRGDQARVAGALLVALALHAAGTALIPGYSSEFSIRAMLVLASLLAIASIGQTLVIIIGGIDLSIPFVIGFANVVSAQLYGQETDFTLVCLIVLVIAALVGSVTGALSSSLNFHPPIVPPGLGTIV